MTPAVLRLRGISKRFGGVQALQNVDLQVQQGTVHCLIGENGSGKSTLIKIASGVLEPDAGEIEVAGRVHGSLTPRQALRYGIEVIHQDLSLFPNLTVAENIAFPPFLEEGRRFFRDAESRRVASAIVGQLGIALDLDAAVEDLPMADKQITAICRGLTKDVRLLFMDEPTAALTWREVQALFGVVQQLKARGVSAIFVSHKLDEVLTIADHITVLRNGVVVADGPARDFDRTVLIRAMTGRELTGRRGEWVVPESAPTVLEVRGLSVPGAVDSVSFSVRRGEIVGLVGLLGSGTAEIIEALFGIVHTSAGEVLVAGRPRTIRLPTDAIAAGIGYVPNDRVKQGLFLRHPISWNVIAANPDAVSTRAGFLRWGAVYAGARHMMGELHIAAPSPETPAGQLSGGNQQRVVLAKWLWTHPALLLLNGPTVGVDVGSKEDIHRFIRSLSEAGTSAVVVSDDVPELVALCHRVLVLRRGRVAGELSGPQVTDSAILRELQA